MEYEVGSLADMISGSSGKKRSKSKEKTGMPKVKFEKVSNTKNISKKKIQSEDEDEEPSQKRSRFSESTNSPVKKSKSANKVKKQNSQFIDEQKRTIFVGNVIKTSTKDDMRRIFSKYGFIETIRFRSVSVADPRTSKKVAVIKKELHPNRSNMNAYIKFRDVESAEKALVENGTIVNGHTLRVDMALGDGHSNPKESVFVGNLKFLVEEENLRKAFEDCGKILNIRIVRDKATGMGRGIAFIEFEDSQSVELALRLNDEKLMGRAMRVSRVGGKAKGSMKGGKSGAVTGKKFVQSSPQVDHNGINVNTSAMGKSKKAIAKQHETSQKNVSEFQGEKTDQKKAKKKKKQNRGELNKKIMQSKLGIIPKAKQTKPGKKI